MFISSIAHVKKGRRFYMPFALNLSACHNIVAANSHFYEKPTERLYLNRTLQYHDLIYLVKGQWLITEGNIDYLMEKDDVLLLSAGHHHYTRLPCLPNTRTMCIHVTCEPGDLDEATGTLLPTYQHTRGTPSVKEYFTEIISVFWSNRSYKQERMTALFNLLMLELAEMRTGVQENRSLAEEIIQLINMTPHQNFRVAEIAERFGVSAKTIETIMHCSVGMSFTKYQMSRKLEMVAQQIQVEPDLRFSEIASIFGFYDEFHMSRSFKAKYGIPPAQYRKEILAGQTERSFPPTPVDSRS